MKNLQNKEQVLISKFQQRCLWEGIIVDWISKEKIDGELIGISDSWQLANKALEAWYILNIWNIPLASLKKYFWSKESQSFLEWANRYKLICQQLNYVDQIHKNPFMDFKSSIAVTAHQGEQLHCFKIPCWDFVQEVNMAANWAKKLTGNIGIVILDLEQVHSQVDYIFSNFLKETEYNISRSPKLNDSPLINIVLLILQIANSYITNDYIKYEDFSKLLRTKFIVGADLELCSRSYMDYLLRKELDYEFNWQYLINKLQINK